MSKRSRDILLILERLLLGLILTFLAWVMILAAGKGIRAVVNVWGIRSVTLRVVIDLAALSFTIMAVSISLSCGLLSCFKAIAGLMDSKTGSALRGILTPRKKAEQWAIALGWWIPRRYREDIVGDILEDCNEMRDKRCGEWRIRIQVIWQWAIAVGSLIPSAVFGGIWRIFSHPK